MKHLPPEIINYIFSFIQSQTNKLMKYVIDDCYEEDYDPYSYEYCEYHEIYWYNYCYDYSFIEWYFLYRKNHINKRNKYAKYKHTPKLIPVGHEKLYLNIILK